VDADALQAPALRIAAALSPAFHSIIIASLDRTQIYAVHEMAAGVILAAGKARRMGKPKQLLSWRGQPLVRHSALAALAAGLSPVCVVLGAYEEQVRGALDGLPLTFISNPEWESGQSSSMKAGLSALPEQVGSAIFLLADQPKASESLLRALVEHHAQTLAPVLAPMIDGKRGNPVLFDRHTFGDLQLVQGDIGGRAIFSRYPVAWVDWNDPGAGMDVDTEEDYQRLLESDPGNDG
jgi:molybdenum cofactor cytidylyltransferase